MSESKGYFSRSWALIGKEPGWYKVPLVMGIANFVPIAGALGTSGYVLEWSRLIAWGADVAPKRHDIRVGECIKSGWRGFVAMIGWGVLLGIVLSLVSYAFDGGLVPFLLSLVVGVFSGTVLAVCGVRAVIYQSFAAGYRADRIFDMLKRDFGGIARIAGLCILISMIITLAMYLVALIVFIPLITKVIGMAALTGTQAYSPYMDDSYYIYSETISMFTSMIPMLLVIGYLGSVATSFASLVQYAAIGLWMRQFNVPAWGASGDPLPQGLMLDAASAVPGVPVDPTAGTTEVAGVAPVDPTAGTTEVAGAAPVAPAAPIAEVVTPLVVPASMDAPTEEAPAAAAEAPTGEAAAVVEELTVGATTAAAQVVPTDGTVGEEAGVTPAADGAANDDAATGEDAAAASDGAADEGTTL